VKQRVRTIHTSRTMMFDELNSLISHNVFNEQDIIELNLLNKISRSNINKTLKFLSGLYDFKSGNELWKVFLLLWKYAEEWDRRIMTLLYALYKDELLYQTAPVILNTPHGKKVIVENILDAINKAWPDHYAQTTAFSAAQNIASSWKQAGYIQGRVRNIRVPAKPEYPAVIFALYLGKIDGFTGEDLFSTNWIKILEVSDSRLRELLSQAAIRDMIDYRQGGGITIIKFDKILTQIES